MSKYKTVKVWNKVFGNRETVFDYAGREMRKSACGDPHSAYAEKADKFPHWKTNRQLFRADRIKGTRTDYEIIKL